jgi:hypothetical protein
MADNPHVSQKKENEKSVNILMFMFCSYCDIDQILYCRNTATLHIVFFDNKILKMDKI